MSDAEADADADAEVGPCPPVDCASPDPCLGTSCGPAGACALALTSTSACCFDAVLATDEAESADTTASVYDLAPSSAPAVGWNRSPHRAFTGEFSWYFGDPTALDFDTGERVAGRLELAPVALPADRPSRLVFHVYADVEAGPIWDVLVVRVLDPAAPAASVPVYVKDAALALGSWQRVSVDLAAFAGRTVTIQFDFDSVEATLNDTEGVSLDAIWVLSGCAPLPSCQTALDCDDAVACTSQTCAAQGQCAFAPVSACCALASDCDDGDPCTSDTCAAGTCAHAPQSGPGCCDCDDGDPCTVDTCPDDLCSHAPSTALSCCAPAALAETFEDPFTAWTFSGGGADCSWYIEPTTPAGGGPGGLAYGNGANYDCGLSAGVARSPSMTLAAGVRWTLEARLWLDTEVPSSVDILSLHAISPSGAQAQLWVKPAGLAPQKKWLTVTADLSAFGGLELALEWRFDTADANNNAGKGPHIDSVSLVSDCEARTCVDAPGCDDLLSATTEDCVDGACVFVWP
ncbi:MAG: hypothetical protein R3F39_04725 [Myxococcota bacterium]